VTFASSLTRLRTGPALRRLAVAAAVLVAAGAASAAKAPAEPPHAVRDPHYGDTLFSFFQGRYFSAVTDLMASQQFGRVPKHADEAEVLRGGLLLSYGLHREAAEVFTHLIERGASPPVRDRAWFYLAKVRHQRGLPAEAEAALGRIQGRLPLDLEDERGLLLAQLLTARGDPAGAARVLGSMTAAGTTAARYARYNLGVALVRSGDLAGGSRWLEELGRATAPDEETRSLRDQANVALGFAALQASQPQAARGHLERVRLTGLHANKALLGFGWAAAALKEPKLALVPWLELGGRDAADAAVLEARIAVPYAYAELGAGAQALARYQQAVAAFEAEGRALDESVAALRTGRWLDDLLALNPGEEMGWFWRVEKLPAGLPHASHLTPLLASHAFQEALKNHRDLVFLSMNLREGAGKLEAFGDMLANRRQAFAERLPAVREKAGRTGLDALQQRTDGLVRELASAEAAADGVALADAGQRELLARLERVRATLAQLPDGEEAALARDRARLAAGALTWQLAQQVPDRLWQARKALRTTEAELAEAHRRDNALAEAAREEPQRFDRFGGRIGALDGRVRALAPRVDALGREQRQVLQDLAVAELERQKARLAIYTGQARFAMAQLQDHANLRDEEGTDAARP
jgi:hypothetical protein